MRVETVSESKGKKTGSPTRAIPREGTKLRALYDFFKSSPGEPLAWNSKPDDCARIRNLVDFYGLDIRNIKYGTWVLAGEWFGSTYKDYIAERLSNDRQS